MADGMTGVHAKLDPDVGPPEANYLVLPVSSISVRHRRLDAEVYLSNGFLTRRAIENAVIASLPLGSLASVWQPGRLKGIKVDPKHGEPFLTATQVFDILPTPRKWLAADKTPDLAGRLVSPGWILITCSGTVGHAIMTYSAHTHHVISHDLLRVQIAEPVLRNYVYAFLRTRFGRAMMQGSHYGNVIKHIEVEHLKQIPVPMLDYLKPEIHAQIESVFSTREAAYELDMSARRHFEDAMSDRPLPLREEGYVVAASQLFERRRLDGAAFAPAPQFLRQVYERNASRVEALSKSSRVFVPGRFKRIYGNKGTPYLDSEPIFKINPVVGKHLTSATRINVDSYMVQRGWLLMACSGQTYGINGQTILANEWHEGKIITQHIMRIVPDESVRPGYLQTVLSHPILGKPLVVSQAYGTSVPELSPDDIERLPIPRLASNLEEAIADAAERANALRRCADLEENSAVSRLETELEAVLEVPKAMHDADLSNNAVETVEHVR